MKKKLNLLFVALFVIATMARPQEISEIRNFMRLNEQFCAGGQPALGHLDKLKAEGVKTIINLRPPQEFNAAPEEARAKELGLQYFNIPVDFTNPKDEWATEFLRLTDDARNRPAFIHCAVGIRAGAFWLIRRVLRDGWNVKDAEAEAAKVGLRPDSHWREFALNYINRQRKN